MCIRDSDKMIGIRKVINLKNHQTLFFTSIKYNNELLGKSNIEIGDLKNSKVLLVTGIADDKVIIDYLESKNIQETLHIGGAAAKHDGLIKVNMGGIVVTQDVLNDCLDIDPNDPLDFDRDFEVGIVGDDESPENKYQFTQGYQPGQHDDYPDGLISGRNVMVYYKVRDKDGKATGERKAFAKKTQRAGDGPSSKLRSLYTWSDETQECFKNHPSNKLENK